MTIRNKDLYDATHWDWSCLDGCFSNGISVSDIDGVVERKGKFLILETKSLGAKLSVGQRRMFDSFAKLGAEVMVIWGTPGRPESVMVLTGEKQIGPVESSLSDVRSRICSWFSWANGDDRVYCEDAANWTRDQRDDLALPGAP